MIPIEPAPGNSGEGMRDKKVSAFAETFLLTTGFQIENELARIIVVRGILSLHLLLNDFVVICIATIIVRCVALLCFQNSIEHCVSLLQFSYRLLSISLLFVRICELHHCKNGNQYFCFDPSITTIHRSLWDDKQEQR